MNKSNYAPAVFETKKWNYLDKINDTKGPEKKYILRHF